MELTTSDVAVRVCTDDRSAAYTFRCPHCRMIVAKPAEPRIVELLVASGVALHTWQLPAELGERPVGAAALTHDDLLDFHTLLLDDDRWAGALARLVDG
ncbi:MAG: hypothetical protein HYX34_13915 [Actinobacteria bacterium]|nr:hypothetical protein [Actinomycetota bacterium]